MNLPHPPWPFKGHVPAPAPGLPRGPDAQSGALLGQQVVDQEHQVAGELQGPGPDPLDPGVVNHPQGSQQRGGGQHGRRGDLPTRRAGLVAKLRVHGELPLLDIPPPTGQERFGAEVPPVDVEKRRASGPPVEVLVAAPEGKVHPPGVEAVRHRAYRMAAVQADQDVPFAGGAGQSLEVQELAAAVQDRGQQHQGYLFVHASDQLRLVEGPCVPALGQHQQVLRGESPELELSRQGVEIRGEVQAVGEDPAPAALRPVEGSHEGVEVHRRGPRTDHLLGGGTDQGRGQSAQGLSQGEPGRVGLEPAADSQGLPLPQGPGQLRDGLPGGKAQGVAVQVDPPPGSVEAPPKRGQRVPPVRLPGEALGGLKAHPWSPVPRDRVSTQAVQK